MFVQHLVGNDFDHYISVTRRDFCPQKIETATIKNQLPSKSWIGTSSPYTVIDLNEGSNLPSKSQSIDLTKTSKHDPILPLHQARSVKVLGLDSPLPKRCIGSTTNEMGNILYKQLFSPAYNSANFYNNSLQPKLGSPESSNISPALALKITSNPDRVAVFFHQLNVHQSQSLPNYTVPHDATWNDPDYVRSLFSSKYIVRNSNQQYAYKWDLVQTWLTNLSQHCISQASNNQTVDFLMKTTTWNYDPDVQNKTDFMNLTHPDIASCMKTTIPLIVHHALKLPSLLAAPIPFLKQYQNKTIYLTKKLVCSLLANAFFCTLHKEKGEMQDINFHSMFNTTSRGNAKAEKLKCILNYFQQMSKPGENPSMGDRVISFERRCILTHIDWAKSSKKLTMVEVEQRKKIEDAHGMLKVDFANKRVGGGVMNEGAVMEEILFAACPELIISRLFTEPLEDDEVLIVTGAEQFSNYEGYSRSFRYAGPAKPANLDLDELNRLYTPIVVMDALHFKGHEIHKQFEKQCVDRELHKALVGFLPSDDGINIPVATGNWGCGAFNGDTELKFLIQWMAASQSGRCAMVYHTISDASQTKSIQALVRFLKRRNACVGDLYKIVLSYQKRQSRNPSVFEFVKNIYSGR